MNALGPQAPIHAPGQLSLRRGARFGSGSRATADAAGRLYSSTRASIARRASRRSAPRSTIYSR